MKVALFGESSCLKGLRDFINENPNYFDDQIEIAYIIKPPPSYEEFCANTLPALEEVSIREVVDLYREKKIDGAIFSTMRILRTNPLFFKIQKMIRYLKLNGVKKIATVSGWLGVNLMWLSPEKFLLGYIETSIIDGCNLNCRGCVNFSSLFTRDEIYPLEKFERDLKNLSSKIDLQVFRLMGGEPFLLKNLDEYLELSRKYFPQTKIIIVTNGLLIPTVDQKILETIKKLRIAVSISEYPPTTKIRDKIAQRLESQEITFKFETLIREFRQFIRNKPERSNPFESIKHCLSAQCQFLRDGKIYKCQTDALAYRYAEKFPNDTVLPPPPSSISIDSANFIELLDYVIRPWHVVPMCEFCSDENNFVPWRVATHPTAEDWKS